MELPKDIEQQVLEYLQCEYGEDSDSVGSLELSDLKYEGVHEVDGFKSHCWSFPSSEDNVWATAAIDIDTYYIGLSEIPPALRPPPYAVLKIEILGQDKQRLTIPYVRPEESLIASLEKPLRLVLPNGKEVAISSDIYFNRVNPQGILAIRCGGQAVTLRFAVGMELTYLIDSETEIRARTGDLS